MAKRQHELADAHAVGVAQRQHGQPARVDADEGEVHAAVEPDRAPVETAAVGQAHLDPLGLLDDMGVGDDETAGLDDEAGAGGAARLGG